MNLAVKNSLKGAMFATAAGAMVVAGTGIASANHLPAVSKAPTAANQVCGVVKDAAGMGVHPATVTGTLSGTPTWTDSTTTDPDGGWCLTGDAGMATRVQNGDYVTLTATYNGVTQTWKTSSGSSNIDKWVFLDHGVRVGAVLLPNSAAGFDFTF